MLVQRNKRRRIREEWVKTHRMRSSSCKPIIAHINWRLQNYIRITFMQNLLPATVYGISRKQYFWPPQKTFSHNKNQAYDANFVCAGIRITKSTWSLGPFLPIERNKKLNVITITHPHTRLTLIRLFFIFI